MAVQFDFNWQFLPDGEMGSTTRRGVLAPSECRNSVMSVECLCAGFQLPGQVAAGRHKRVSRRATLGCARLYLDNPRTGP